MRSIPWAMTWTMLRRNPWGLLGALLGANLLPVLLLTALRAQGGVDPHDPAMIVMHVVLSQVSVFVFAAALFGAQGPISKLFCYPASTATIVTWRLLPAMALAALGYTAGALAINAMFAVDWPVLGPALTVAAALAAIQAAFWLTYESAWMVVAVGAVGSVIGIWHKSRYGPPFSPPSRLWQLVTPTDMAVLIAITVLGFVGSVIGVTRLRRGDRVPALGIAAWLLGALDRAPGESRRFQSPEAAQAWFEWRRKGWVMPAIVIFGMLCALFGWLVDSRESQELFDGFIAGGFMLSVMGMLCGLVFGIAGPNDTVLQIGQYLATRPIASERMARTVLKSLARSVLIAWLIWLVAFLIMFAILRSNGFEPKDTFRQHAWWYFPATLVGPWIVASLGASLGLIGNEKLLTQVLFSTTAVLLGGMIFGSFALSEDARNVFKQLAACSVGVGFLCATIVAAYVARRRALIDLPLIVTAICVWLLLSACVVVVANQVGATLAMMIFGCGVAALAVAPLAAAPLALARNRTR
jgi:hypothetical protein